VQNARRIAERPAEIADVDRQDNTLTLKLSMMSA
jgi:hypothetical protein